MLDVRIVGRGGLTLPDVRTHALQSLRVGHRICSRMERLLEAGVGTGRLRQAVTGSIAAR